MASQRLTPGGQPRHVYIHVPFCRARCDYCDFSSVPLGAPGEPLEPCVPSPGARVEQTVRGLALPETARDELLDRYVDALLAEWELERAALGYDRRGFAGERRGAARVHHGAARVHTLFLGGGTPSLLGAARLERLLSAFDGHLTAGAEVTVETNPEDVAAGYAEWAAGRGLRISLGVQSFVPRLRAALGRRAQSDPAAAFRRLRTAGCANVGVDLIFGVPSQTADGLNADLTAVADLRPDHVSWYELDVIEGTTLARRLEGLGVPVAATSGDGCAVAVTVAAARPDDDTRAAMYRTIVRGLGRLGYRWYEVSNFARPGRRCRHNSAVWRGEDYLGLGAGAVGTVWGERRQNEPDLAGYLAALAPRGGAQTRGGARMRGGRRPQAPPRQVERLAPAERARERLYLAARTGAALPLRDVEEVLDPVAMEPLARAGFVRAAGGTLRVTRKGRFVADELSVRLFRDSCVRGASGVPRSAAGGSASREME